MDHEVGTSKNCGGSLIYIYCLDTVKCEDCNEDEE